MMTWSGAQEFEISEAGEEDLMRKLYSCKKNPGHTEFIPVDEFDINNLPESVRDSNLVELINVTAYLTVRVDTKITSAGRPEWIPNTTQPYPYHVTNETKVTRHGSGIACLVNRWTEEYIRIERKGPCQCFKCKDLETPSYVWGEVIICTARQVVYDDTEARHATCRMFYDRPDSPGVTLENWTLVEAKVEEDWCKLKHQTCDADLLATISRAVRHRLNLWLKIHQKYKELRDEITFTFMVSHPHGSPKRISVGHWIDRLNVREHRTAYTYTMCTCPGSSGACVHSLGYANGFFYVPQVHSGVTPGGLNISNPGRDVP